MDSDNLGTLAGLIADLEKLHWTDNPNFFCACDATWPCPTIELVRKHKRAMYYIQTDGYYRNDEDVPDEEPSQVFLNQSIHNVPEWFFAGTYAECVTWIEKQVTGE